MKRFVPSAWGKISVLMPCVLYSQIQDVLMLDRYPS